MLTTTITTIIVVIVDARSNLNYVCLGNVEKIDKNDLNLILLG